jgi:hypothetical protein
MTLFPSTTLFRSQLVDEHAGETRPDFAENVLRAIPIQVGGLFPITDVWHIESSLDTPERLRLHIAQFAREIAGEAGLSECITSVERGIGFVCTSPADSLPEFGRAVLALLRLLSGDSAPALQTDLAALLLIPGAGTEPSRLSDEGLIKFFRLLRLARRLLDIETGAALEG